MLLMLFVWPPVGGGFLLLPPRLHPKFSRRENCWEVPIEESLGSMLGYRAYYFHHSPTLHTHHTRCKRYHLTSDTHMLTPVASISYGLHIRISTYMLTVVTSEVPRSLSRRKPSRFLRTHSRSIFQDTERETSYPTVL